MKLCISLFPLLFFFFLFVFFTSIYAAQDYDECQNNYTCSGITARYPFWGGDRPAFCGPPGFNLSCIEDVDELSGRKYTAIDIDGMRFQVIEINQLDYILRIARSDLWEIPCSNDGLKNNMSLAYTFFDYIKSANENLTLFYGCSDLEKVEANLAPRFNCSKNGEFVDSIYYLNNSLIKEVEGNPWFNDCYKESIKVCILELNLEKLDAEGSLKLQTYINEGCGVEYPADIAKVCSDCEDQGQLCAYNGSFVCANKSSGRKSSVKLWIAIAAGTTCAVLLIICAAFCLIRSKNESMVRWKKTPADREFEAFLRQHGSLAPKRYTYSEIKRITGSFKEKLGKGGFGEVYKGKIPNGRLVAVKLLHISKGNREDFMNEVASISRTSHVNVVTLLGFCLQGRRRALVYEFMPNGSLEKFVYTDKTLHSSQQLGWEKLYQITIGIARGLEYLHRGCNTRILHFDIKPHNILLDEKFSPKISDFGLAKLCFTNDSKISMLEARGTIGYIAPEVFSRNFGPVSHKSDVYSYGMMVLEMVGGRQNLNVGVSNTSEIYFPHWIYKRLELGTEFQGLQGLTTGEETEIVRKMILVGLWCIQPNPSDRPAISKVIEMLEGSIRSLDIPPRHFLSSPPRSPPPESMSDSTTTLSSICTSKN